MANITVAGDRVTLHLTTLEHAEGFHRDIDAPLASITTVRVSNDPWSDLRGIRAPGTGIPGVVAVGTRRGTFGKDFAAVHGQGPGVVVEFSGENYGRWVITAANATEIVAAVESARGRGIA